MTPLLPLLRPHRFGLTPSLLCHRFWLSVAFNPAHAPFAGMERSLSRKLAARGLTVAILRVMDRPAEPKPVGKR